MLTFISKAKVKGEFYYGQIQIVETGAFLDGLIRIQFFLEGLIRIPPPRSATLILIYKSIASLNVSP